MGAEEHHHHAVERVEKLRKELTTFMENQARFHIKILEETKKQNQMIKTQYEQQRKEDEEIKKKEMELKENEINSSASSSNSTSKPDSKQYYNNITSFYY